MTTADVCVIMFTWLLMDAMGFQVAVYNMSRFSGVGTCSGVTTVITLVFIVIIQDSA